MTTKTKKDDVISGLENALYTNNLERTQEVLESENKTYYKDAFDSMDRVTSDGSTASYYELPHWARELADLIRYKNMNGSQAEMFRALYRGVEASHSDDQRQAKKVLAYAVDEMMRTHFPEQSMAQYRNQVFAVFFPEES